MVHHRYRVPGADALSGVKLGQVSCTMGTLGSSSGGSSGEDAIVLLAPMGLNVSLRNQPTTIVTMLIQVVEANERYAMGAAPVVPREIERVASHLSSGLIADQFVVLAAHEVEREVVPRDELGDLAVRLHGGAFGLRSALPRRIPYGSRKSWRQLETR